MKNSLVMELYSQEPLGPANAEAQILALSTFEQGLFRPEKCDVHEPVRERFHPEDLGEPVRWLSQPGGQFTFRRNKSTRVQGYISNLQYREISTRDSKGGPWASIKPRFPEPVFITRWAVWLDSAVARKDSAVLSRFLVRMFQVSMSEYGFLTTEEDHRKKNFQVTQDGTSTLERYVGTDPADGVPGLYWMNLFGSTYADWLGREKLRLAPGMHESLADGSEFIKFGEAPVTCSIPEILQQQRDVRIALGEEKFFDIENPERRVQSPFTTASGL